MSLSQKSSFESHRDNRETANVTNELTSLKDSLTIRGTPVSSEDVNLVNETLSTDYQWEIDAILVCFNVNSATVNFKMKDVVKKLKKILAKDPILTGKLDLPDYLANPSDTPDRAAKNKLKATEKRLDKILKVSLMKHPQIQKAYSDYVMHPMKEYFRSYKDLRAKLVENQKKAWKDGYISDIFQLLSNDTDKDRVEARMWANPIIDFQTRKYVATEHFEWGKDDIEKNFSTLMSLESWDTTYWATKFDQIHDMFKSYLADATLFWVDGEDTFYVRKNQFGLMKVWGRSSISYWEKSPLTWSETGNWIEVDDYLETFEN